MTVQAILFDKKMFSKLECDRWLHKHGYIRIKKIHETEHFYRCRLIEPSEFKKFISVKIKKGIIFVIGMK